MKILKAEKDQLAASGLPTEEARTRYRELTLQQEQLRSQAEAEIAQR
jgi:DNA primase